MNSPLAKKATYEIGGNYQAIAVYDLAAEWYESYAKGDPKAPRRRQGARRRRHPPPRPRPGGGGHQGRAGLHARTTAPRSRRRRAAIAFAIGAHYAEKEDWDKARGALTGVDGHHRQARRPTSSSRLTPRSVARYAKLGSGEPRAKAEYAKVRALWTDPAAAEAKIRAAYPTDDDAQRDRRLAQGARRRR